MKLKKLMKLEAKHVPVLLKEVIEGLALKEGDVVVDATFGDGGHAREICKKIGDTGTLVGIDLDEEALERGRALKEEFQTRIILEKENFKNLEHVLEKHGFKNAHKVLFDLGLRSGELEESGRGFSFRRDEPLIMTFEAHPTEEKMTAEELLGSESEEELARIIWTYGEERFARRIAHAIVIERKKKKIKRTTDLVAVLEKAIPFRYQNKRLHFATKTFQALRIAVNDELENLKIGLQKALTIVAPEGRVAVISFHSLEDRIVKNFFRECAQTGEYVRITKKPIIQSEGERMANPRGRSAKLRIIQRAQYKNGKFLK